MKAPGYNWLRFGAYVLIAGGMVCSVFAWLYVLAGANSMIVVIFCMQALLSLFTAVDALRSKGSPARARNCIIDALCVFCLNVIVMIETGNGFAWYVLPSMIGAAMVVVGGSMNYKAK